MARKTVSDLEAENKALKEQLASSANDDAIAEENKVLRESVELNKKAKEEAEARLVSAIEDMETPIIIDGQVQDSTIQVFTGDGYTEDLKRRGIKIVSAFDIETLRAFINSDWSPQMVMEKFGLTEKELQSYIYKLSKKELRDKPIKLDLKRDLFGREG